MDMGDFILFHEIGHSLLNIILSSFIQNNRATHCDVCDAVVCFIHSIISSIVPDSRVGRLIVNSILVIIDIVEFEVFLVVAFWLNVHSIASLIVFHIGAPLRFLVIQLVSLEHIA